MPHIEPGDTPHSGPPPGAPTELLKVFDSDAAPHAPSTAPLTARGHSRDWTQVTTQIE